MHKLPQSTLVKRAPMIASSFSDTYTLRQAGGTTKIGHCGLSCGWWLRYWLYDTTGDCQRLSIPWWADGWHPPWVLAISHARSGLCHWPPRQKNFPIRGESMELTDWCGLKRTDTSPLSEHPRHKLSESADPDVQTPIGENATVLNLVRVTSEKVPHTICPVWYSRCRRPSHLTLKQ